MGISSTGILYWGLDFGEDRPWINEETPYEEDEFDPGDAVWMANGASQSDSYEIRREAEKDMGVEFVIHCSYDYSMWGLGVSESILRAYRGNPISIKELVVKPEWEVMLWIAREKLAKTFDDSFLKGGPTWHLTSVYG